MKNFDIQSALFFGFGMTLFFVFQNIFSMEMSFINSIIFGIMGGVGSGFLFGLFTGFYKTSKSYIRKTQIEIEENENIIFQTNANRPFESGKLYLTDRRLVFKPSESKELSIDLNNIVKVNRHNTLGIISNGISVTENGNKIHKFAVEEPENWIKKINTNNKISL